MGSHKKIMSHFLKTFKIYFFSYSGLFFFKLIKKKLQIITAIYNKK